MGESLIIYGGSIIYSFFSEEEQLTNNDYNYYCEFSNEIFSCTVHLMISGGTLLANIREK